MADDFYLPEGYLRRNGINPNAVMPASARSALSLVPGAFQVRSKSDALDLAYRMGGRTAKPLTAPRLLGADGTPIIIAGMGVTEAAEMEEIAIEAWEKSETHKPIDFEESREERGLPPASQFMPLLQQAAEDYTKRKKATSITDPAPPLKGQTLRGLVTVPELKENAA